MYNGHAEKTKPCMAKLGLGTNAPWIMGPQNDGTNPTNDVTAVATLNQK
jgi:hypothetical protein